MKRGAVNCTPFFFTRGRAKWFKKLETDGVNENLLIFTI